MSKSKVTKQLFSFNNNKQKQQTHLMAPVQDYPGEPVPGKTNLDFTEARDSEWQWHQLGHMQACTSLQTDNHATTQFLQALKL